MADRSSCNNIHVAVLVFPFASHPSSVLSLVRRLSYAAPHITFSFFNTAKSNASLFSVDDQRRPPATDEEDKNIRVFNVPDGIPEGYVFSCRKPMEDLELFFEVAEENFKKSLKHAKEEEVIGMKISCVLSDAFLWFSGQIAEDFRVPWIPIWIAGAHSLSVNVYADLIRQIVGIHDVTGVVGRENEIITFVPGLSQLQLGDILSAQGGLNSPASNMLSKMGQILHKSDALVINSIQELESQVIKDLNSRFKNVLNVGPFNSKIGKSSTNFPDPHDCIPWLDTQKIGTVAYIGFGTILVPPPHELMALAEALEVTNIPFIWSFKDIDTMKTHLPEGFLERINRDGRGKIVPWAPQVQILSHKSVGVCVCHCGWGSIMECIVTGVPVIGRPFFADNQMNAWMVEKIWRIGLRIDGDCFAKDSTIRALEFVLKGKDLEGKKNVIKDRIMFYKNVAREAMQQPNGSSTVDFQTLVQIVNAAHLNRPIS